MRFPRLRIRFLMLACLPLLATTMATPAAVAGGNPPITFGVDIGCCGGHITVLNTAHTDTTVRLRDKDGNLKAEGVLDETDPFFNLPADVGVEIGDRIRASDGTFTRRFTVPDLSVTVNRVTDRARGTGPAQRIIKVGWAAGDVFEDRGVRVRADGTWSFQLPFDVRGGQGITLDWKSPKGDRVSTGGSAALLVVTLGSARFIGNSSKPFADVEVLIEGANDGSWSGQSGDFGEFTGRFRRPNGDLIEVAAGDHISALSVASDLDWVVPDVQISADATSEMVVGQCAGTLAVVELYRTGHRRGFVLAVPGLSDEFEFDFSDPMASDYVTGLSANPANVKHGDRLNVQCILGTGDSVLLRTVVP